MGIADILGGGTVPNKSSDFTSNFYGAILNAGVSLVGNYFQQSGAKDLAEQAAADRMKELEYTAEHQPVSGGGGGGGSGAALKIAKMNNLSALYQNYASILAKEGDTESNTALQTGKLAQDPLIARASRL